MGSGRVQAADAQLADVNLNQVIWFLACLYSALSIIFMDIIMLNLQLCYISFVNL